VSTRTPQRGDPPRVAFTTLGCKLNLYETDALSARFVDSGYSLVPFAEPADVYVINSCTVTNRADRKSRNLLYRAQRRTGPSGAQPLVVLTGCYVDSHRDDLESAGNTIVIPNEHKHALYDLVEAERRGELLVPGGSVFDFPTPSRRVHTRTMLKIQDGCDNFCTFCIIPFVRGRAVSRPAPEVLDAAREAIAGGAHELVLTGVNMSRYRHGDIRFSGLVEQLLALPGEWRLRISSLEPDQLDEHFVELFAHPRMCRHLHLCMQSASERILLAMRRQYTFNEFAAVAQALRERYPGFNLTTDVIVGFPGETEEEFGVTLRAVEELAFGHVHTFPYSERRGTRAARMPGRVPERIRTERAAMVREHAAAAKARYRRGRIGETERLLVETVERGDDGLTLKGFGEYYVPLRVAVSATEPGHSAAEWHNRFVDVEITGIEEGEDPPLRARVVQP
jgi:threonylcarbamoyladenosine tRNA methylthiotransferase MtaB